MSEPAQTALEEPLVERERRSIVMTPSTPMSNGGQGPGKQRHISNLFTTWELGQYPKQLSKAIAKAEKQESVRNKLHRLQQKGSVMYGNNLLSRQKYSRVLGQIGYEQLPLSSFSELPSAATRDKRSIIHGANLNNQSPSSLMANDDSIQTETDQGNNLSVRGYVQSIVKEIEGTPWLSAHETQLLSNVFITDIASRYNSLSSNSFKHLSAHQHRDMILRIFTMIRDIKNDIFHRISKAKKAMCAGGLYDEQRNGERLAALFRLELHRRIKSKKIIQKAIFQARGGITSSSDSHSAVEHNRKTDLQEIQEAVDHIIKPHVNLEGPGVSLRTSRHQDKMGIKGVEGYQARWKGIYTSGEAEKELSNIDKIRANQQLLANDLSSLLRRGDKTIEDNEDASSQVTWLASIPDEFEEQALRELNYVDTDVHVFAIHATDDPLLQSHAAIENLGASKPRLQPSIPEIKSSAPERYLSSSKLSRASQGKPHLLLSDLDFDTIDETERETLQSAEKTHDLIGPFILDGLKVDGSKIPPRVPKDFISLSVEPSVNISELGSEIDSEVMNLLDEKLIRFKEVEELYDEIMKTVKGSHLENDDEEDPTQSCPAAPVDPIAPISNTFLGIRPEESSRKRRRRSGGIKRFIRGILNSQRPSSGPVILLRTRSKNESAHVTADEFIKNRSFAMKKLQSSKYHALKYNYGGYIPTAAQDRVHTLKTEFSVDDYNDFLRGKILDFLPSLLLSKEDQEELKGSDNDSETRSETVDEAKLRRQKAILAKKERLAKIFDHDRDTWNASVLDYMAEAQNGIGISKTDLTASSDGLSGKTSNSLTKAGHGAKEEPIRVKGKSQEELERIWMSLKMPLDQKLDMAIKYGSHKNSKLAIAITLWKQVAEQIRDREAILKTLEEFEMSASNPWRFFAPGQEGSSKARLEEASQRELIMRRLHSSEARINKIISQIKNELRETVTYEGAPYQEKMKHDYTHILQKCAAKRKEAEKREATTAESV